MVVASFRALAGDTTHLVACWAAASSSAAGWLWWWWLTSVGVAACPFLPSSSLVVASSVSRNLVVASVNPLAVSTLVVLHIPLAAVVPWVVEREVECLLVV